MSVPHRHQTPLRGVKAIPRPQPGDPAYAEVNYRYAGQTGHIHEVVTIGGSYAEEKKKRKHSGL